MGIFDTPKELAFLLASVNNNSRVRPLSPVQVAEYLRRGSIELGSEDEVMRRVDLKKSMWTAFKNLLKLPEDVRETVCWGKPNPDTFEIGFSVAHYIAEGLNEHEQRVIVNTMWDHDRPYTADEIKRIKSYYKSNPNIGIEEAIAHILKIDRPVRNVIYILISKLSKDSYAHLNTQSKRLEMTLDSLASNLLSRFFTENSLTSVKIYPAATKVVFTELGEKELNNHIKNGYGKKKNIIENLLLQEITA